MKNCKICSKDIVKNPHESYKQYNKRVTCSIACQAKLRVGIPLKEEIKEKLRVALKGRIISPENLEKLMKSVRGRKQTEEHKKNAVVARGFTFTPKEKRAEYRYFYEILRKYKMTKQQYEDLLSAQKNVCEICKKTNKENRRLAVDHCHKNGNVRGLLCRECNTALGLVNDDIETLQAMINYLSK